jgi:hypothetical protein
MAVQYSAGEVQKLRFQPFLCAPGPFSAWLESYFEGLRFYTEALESWGLGYMLLVVEGRKTRHTATPFLAIFHGFYMFLS